MPDVATDVQTGFLISASAGIRKRKYTCVCPGKHAVCLRQGPKRVAHFAHIPVRGQDTLPTCRNGGESEQHIRAKHKLVEWQGRYRFALKTCKVCRKKTMEDCSNGKLEIEMQSTDKRWRYDVLLTRHDDKSQLALEVYHKHATGEDKAASSTLLGVPIAEFDAQDILDLQPGGTLDNKRDASWICSQRCVDRKRREEQELLRRQQEEVRGALEEARRQEEQELLKRQQEEAMAVEFAKRREAARISNQLEQLKRQQEEADRKRKEADEPLKPNVELRGEPYLCRRDRQHYLDQESARERLKQLRQAVLEQDRVWCEQHLATARANYENEALTRQGVCQQVFMNSCTFKHPFKKP